MKDYKKKIFLIIPAGFVRVYVASNKVPLIEAINLQPIHINYILFSSIKVDNSSVEYYFDCGDVKEETPIVTEVPMKCTASTHTPTFVLNVIFTSLALNLLIRNQ